MLNFTRGGILELYILNPRVFPLNMRINFRVFRYIVLTENGAAARAREKERPDPWIPRNLQYNADKTRARIHVDASNNKNRKQTISQTNINLKKT